MNNFNRRDFMKIVGGGMTMAAFPEMLLANDRFSDYKALVVVDLLGGSDGMNMFIPADGSQSSKDGYEVYAKTRSAAVRITAKDYMSELRNLIGNSGYLEFENCGEGANRHQTKDQPYYSDRHTDQSYLKGFYHHQNHGFGGKIATNLVMPELAYWLDKGKGVVVQNVGNLITSATKEELHRDKTIRPPFLFGHDQQATLKSIGGASLITRPTGWLGLLADKWINKYTDSGSPHPIYNMNVNMSPFGANKALFGNATTGMNYNNTGPVAFDNNLIDRTREKEWFSKDIPDMFERLYADIRLKVLNDEKKLDGDWKGVTGNNDIFANVKDQFGRELGNVHQALDLNQIGFDKEPWNYIESFMTAARLIQIGKSNGLKRQVIYISIGGWDSHSNMKYTHALSLRGLSLAIEKFMRGIDHLGLMDKVTLMSVSEFGRSLVTSQGGTEHGWGSNYFVLGGAVKAGTYGTFNDLTPKGPQDYIDKGRYIPTISFSQYYATVLKWFGATQAEIEYALPEIKNFSKQDIGFLKS